jgi:DNA-binding beta-propeller fold protein YncE
MRYRQACPLVAATALLASVTVATASRTQVSPVVRTIAVGSAPLALAVDGRTRHVFVANFGSASVSMLDAGSGAVLATTAVDPYPDALAIATRPGRVFVVNVGAPTGTNRMHVLDAVSGRLLRTLPSAKGTMRSRWMSAAATSSSPMPPMTA